MQKAIKEISEELHLPQEVVEKAYRAYWLFIRKTIDALPLKSDLTKEQFNKLRTNFNLPFLGKLSCTYERWLNIKKSNKYRIIKYDTEHKEDKAHV